MYALFFLSFLLYCSKCLTFLLAPKGVTFNNLIRLGVVWGEGAGAYDRGAFNKDWGCHEEEHIQQLRKQLCEKLSSLPENPFGPFDALCLLIGDRNARIFSQQLELSCRPPIPHSSS